MGMGRSLFWPTIAVGVSLLLAMSVASKCFDGEREVLLKFKRNVLDKEDRLRSWGNHSEDYCRDWEGVRCDDATGHVIRIDLTTMGLSAKGGGKCTTSLPFFELRYLRYLDLSFNFKLLPNQSISSLIGNNTMLSLQHLNLMYTGIVGTIPETFGSSMPALTYLDLSYNTLQGSVPEALGNMSVLEHLDLSVNRLEGEIPKFIWNICTLKVLRLDFNSLSGNLITSTLCSNHTLQVLHLSRNRLTGSFPDLTKFPSLVELTIGHSLLGGVISEHHLVTLPKLRILELSSNNFTFNITSTWLPPFQLEYIHLSSCNLGPRFPNWLRTQVNISNLDISNNAISDSIPSWFWTTPLTGFMEVNISNNGIKGKIVIGAQASVSGDVLDMSSNQLEGAIPPCFLNVKLLFLSQNNFTDLNSLCDVKAFSPLQLLDVSSNQLSGTLPDCWSYLSSLEVLYLGNNHNLSGTLPTSIGSLTSLKTLHLDNNNFTGPLPSSIKNCSNLVSLDLGHNNLFGSVPDWVGESLTQLVILVLTKNNFNASVPTSLCHLQSLQLLDLSLNHISGTLPKCLSNLTQMITVTGGDSNNSIASTTNLIWYHTDVSNNSSLGMSIDEVIAIRWKGVISEFGRTLRYVKSIDLSSNMLDGEIPTEITSLVGLVSLNLSQNNLRGHIPPRIGNLAHLDTLDLSSNRLSGSIPQSLALIPGISVLNVSNNNLSGKIPKGTQLQSFNASSYTGNPALCGDPLLNSCPGEESTRLTPPRWSEEGASNREEEDTLLGGEFYASIGVGYAVGFLGVLGTMLFNRSCRFAFFKVLEDLGNWTCVVVAMHKARLLRSLVVNRPV